MRLSVPVSALCLGLAASALAAPNVTLRVSSFKDVSDAVNAVTAAIGQPMLGVRFASEFRDKAAEISEIGAFREDAPAFVALRVENALGDDFDAEDVAEGFLALPFENPDAARFARKVLGGPAEGAEPEENGSFVVDDTFVAAVSDPALGGYLVVGKPPYDPASVAATLAAAPACPGAVVEAAATDLAALGLVAYEAQISEMAETLAGALSEAGVPVSAKTLGALLGANLASTRDVDAARLGIFSVPGRGLVLSAATDVKPGTRTAARLASAKPLAPAALAGVPASAPAFFAAGSDPEQDLETVLPALRDLVGEMASAPAFAKAAPGLRDAMLRQLDASRAAAAARRAGSGYLFADPATGRPGFAFSAAYEDPAPFRECLAAFRDALGALPPVAAGTNGIVLLPAPEDGNGAAVELRPAEALRAVAARCGESDCGDYCGIPPDRLGELDALLAKVFGEKASFETALDPATGVARASFPVAPPAVAGASADPGAFDFLVFGLPKEGPGPVFPVAVGACGYSALVRSFLPFVDGILPDLRLSEAAPRLFEGVPETSRCLSAKSVAKDALVQQIFVPFEEMRFLANAFGVARDRMMEKMLGAGACPPTGEDACFDGGDDACDDDDAACEDDGDDDACDGDAACDDDDESDDFPGDKDE